MMKEKGKPGFGTLYYGGKEFPFGLNEAIDNTIYEMSVSRIVSASWPPSSKSAYDKCKEHKWKHHKKLPKDWIYCTNCKTQQHEDLK